ncbi:2067_t:CDS:1 [Funneliformis geosporum]|uniref:18148_t:CDS:1 n=1 Tax=Funneliformis geosporum TaxID=1117311 RepID=A0A9W4SRX2_9GLOM|nr:2067_t:CDS:1 [Funneliformis geosporum]CAI2178357.1 18148_t:CDS:1 [Funneliformis geosporum]
MKLQLFSSKEKENVFLDLEPGQTINIYLCGPTVYDHIHIGNLRPVIIFDILHRLLLHLNIKVNYVQNITDIDDKIIVRANKEKKTEKKVSDHYTNAYLANLIRYNILLPSALPRVTNYISEIQEFIFSLVEKKIAYQQNNEVLFRIGVNKDYGKLSKQNLEKLKPGTREINKTSKESELDFVL